MLTIEVPITTYDIDLQTYSGIADKERGGSLALRGVS